MIGAYFPSLPAIVTVTFRCDLAVPNIGPSIRRSHLISVSWLGDGAEEPNFMAIPSRLRKVYHTICNVPFATKRNDIENQRSAHVASTVAPTTP